MSDYITDSKSCRSILIGNYFNDNNITACGICDNCINNKASSLGSNEFKSLADDLLESLKKTSLKVNEIEQKFKHRKKQHLWTVINFLRAENIIISDKDGNIRLK